MKVDTHSSDQKFGPSRIPTPTLQIECESPRIHPLFGSICPHSSDQNPEKSTTTPHPLVPHHAFMEDMVWNISGDTGLVSAGRIYKDTPPLTTPGHTSKSSAMDISSHIFQIEIHGGGRQTLPSTPHAPARHDARPEGLSVFS